jgi:prolipoprotein diacylglyceryltransferase
MGVMYYYMIDAAAPGLMLAYAVGRGGCQLSGDGDWGVVNTASKPSWLSALPDWMWSFKYPHNVIRESVPIPGCEGKYCYELPEPVFPTPFYEIVMASIIFLILWNIRKKVNTPGILFCVYLILNGLERFFIEFIRVNKLYDVFGLSLSQAQFIALGLIAAGILGFFYFNSTKPDASPLKT